VSSIFQLQAGIKASKIHTVFVKFDGGFLSDWRMVSIAATAMLLFLTPITAIAKRHIDSSAHRSISA
jgi:hypothetical protein